ncbi:MAG: DUF2490 domain-containing protein [Cyclobacteriaceae bacterium]|nr:DUF2490 domain-containing protein [Cyclobacteriaceae bacterium]
MIFLVTIKSKYFLIVLLLFVSTLSFSQVRGQEFQSWNDAILKYQFNDKLAQVGDLGARYYFDMHWSVFYIRPALQWKPTKDITLIGGVAAFYSTNPDFENILDLRVFQAVELVWPRVRGFSIHHRVMVEERWFLTDSYATEFNVRGRYRVGLATPHYKLFGEKRSTYNQLLIEFLDELDKGTILPFSKYQRYTFVIGRDFSKRVGLELHYQVHAIEVDQGIDIQQHIFRIRLKLNLNAS